MFLVNQAMVDLQIGTAGLVALLGYAVVFVGLIALMVVILIEGKFAVAKDQKTEAPKAAAPAPHGEVIRLPLRPLPRRSPFWLLRLPAPPAR